MNSSGDRYEQEADRVSEQVMGMPQPQLPRAFPGGGGCPASQAEQPGREPESLQTERAVAGDTGQVAAPATVHEVLRSPGQPLDPATRAFMEPRFGRDFSQVRVHSGPAADQSSREVNAHAYTVGRDIVFGAGRLAPGTDHGRRLLAHELTHVVQQDSAPRPVNPGNGKGEAAYDPSAQAEHAAGDHAFAPPAVAGRVGAGGLLQRFEPPADVTLVPAMQKPYTRIGEAVADLRRIVPMLSYKPPSYDTAKLIVDSVYKSVDDWMPKLLTTKRLMKVFHSNWLPAHDICWAARNAIGSMFGILHRAQADARLRGDTDPRPSLIDVPLAEVEFAVPYVEKLENAVSYELPGAESLPDVPTKFTRLPRSEAHVLAWLQKHQAVIASQAASFKVDRRAIAGAIAWEATVQVKSGSMRGVGAGKPHIWEFWGTSAVDEVEEMGYLPEADDAQQRLLLSTPAGSAAYIAAIMGAFADISARYGLNIRNDPGVLATIYQGWRPTEWEERMEEKAKTHPPGAPWPRPVVANPMGIWVDEHLPYLEEAVGFTAAEQQAIGEKPHGATAEGKTAPLP